MTPCIDAQATAGGLNVAMDWVSAVGGNCGEDEGDGGWSSFLNGALGNGNRDANSRGGQYDYASNGMTLGFDYQLESVIVAGFVPGHTEYEVDFDDVPYSSSGSQLTNTRADGNFDTDGYSISGCAIGDVGRLYIDGLLSYR